MTELAYAISSEEHDARSIVDRIYTVPDGEVPVLVPAFGEAALQVAVEHRDG